MQVHINKHSTKLEITQDQQCDLHIILLSLEFLAAKPEMFTEFETNPV